MNLGDLIKKQNQRSENMSVVLGDEGTGAAPAGIPPGAQQIVNTVNGFLPIIEQVTGLSRREIFLQLLKNGFKGGGIESLLNGLMGKTPTPEAKFIKYVKTLALWVPVALFLLGMSIVTVYAFLKLTVIMMGGL